MARKSLIYFLFSENKKPLYEDDNGFIQEGSPADYLKPDGQPANLQNDPEGWKDTLVKYATNSRYWALFRDIVVPMKFTKDGANILRNRMWTTKGVEALTYFGIRKLKRDSLPWKYENWHLTEINFAKFKDTETGVQVEALEGGLSKYLKAYENTDYEIPLDDPDAVNVLMDGMVFDQSSNWFVFDDISLSGYGQHVLELLLLTQETLRNIGSINTHRYHFTDNNNLFGSGIPFLIVGDAPAEINLSWNFSVTPTLADGVSPNPLAGSKLYVREFSEAGVVTNAYELEYYGGASNFYNITHNLNGTFTFTAPAKSRLFLIMVLTIGGTIATGSGADEVVKWTYSQNSETDFFKADYTYKHPATITKGFYFYDLFNKLVKKASNGLYDAEDLTWIKGLKKYVVTCGDGLREIPEAVIKTSIASCFKSLFALEGIMLGIKDNRLQVREFKDRFGSEVILDLGEILTAPVIEVAEDLMFNTIAAGYDAQEYDDVNGRYEFNQGQKWTTNITKVIRELDLKSDYRADSLGAELIRINMEGKTTTDDKSDNDTFVLNVDPEVVEIDDDPQTFGHLLYRPNYTSFSGLSQWETAYNTELSPNKNMRRNGGLIRSLLDLQDGEVISMASADRNADLITTLDGVTIEERGDIQVGSLSNRLFKPYYCNMVTKVNTNLLAIIKSNPYGKIKFTWKGRDWYWYLWDGGIKPATNDKQNWKLLSAPENNLINFHK